jgi:hypothetical protein
VIELTPRVLVAQEEVGGHRRRAMGGLRRRSREVQLSASRSDPCSIQRTFRSENRTDFQIPHVGGARHGDSPFMNVISASVCVPHHSERIDG